jgi:hypothetical protein
MNPETVEGMEAERAQDLEDDLLTMASHARERIEEFVREEPHLALGIAAAAGFVIGGGLTPRRLLRLGMSLGGPTLAQRLASQAAELVSQAFVQKEREERR